MGAAVCVCVCVHACVRVCVYMTLESCLLPFMIMLNGFICCASYLELSRTDVL